MSKTKNANKEALLVHNVVTPSHMTFTYFVHVLIYYGRLKFTKIYIVDRVFFRKHGIFRIWLIWVLRKVKFSHVKFLQFYNNLPGYLVHVCAVLQWNHWFESF